MFVCICNVVAVVAAYLVWGLHFDAQRENYDVFCAAELQREVQEQTKEEAQEAEVREGHRARKRGRGHFICYQIMLSDGLLLVVV